MYKWIYIYKYIDLHIVVILKKWAWKSSFWKWTITFWISTDICSQKSPTEVDSSLAKVIGGANNPLPQPMMTKIRHAIWCY